MTVEEQIGGLRAVAAADDIDVARAAGDDKPGLGPLRSISVLMAIVEPWISSSIAAASTSLLSISR
jgi:hypothetical protein